MQILITHGTLARTRVLQFNRWQLGAALAALVVVLTLLSGTVYHFVFLKAAREGWPVVSPLMRLVVRDEFAQRDRFLRENLDAMAQKVGEVQAKMIKLEAMGERVSGIVGIKPDELKQTRAEGRARRAVRAFRAGLGPVDGPADRRARLARRRGRPAHRPVHAGRVAPARKAPGRTDDPQQPPGRRADRLGLRLSLRPVHRARCAAHRPGLPGRQPARRIFASAGGMVVLSEFHPEYGNMVTLDHGNGLVTRYAHSSRVLVKAGDLIKRGQAIAEVGTSGRSTGAHLHFEVLLDGVPQDPAKFLAGGEAASLLAAKPARARR